MKKIIALLFVASLMVITGCGLDSFSPGIGGLDGVTTQYETDINEYNETTGDPITISVTSGALALAEDQEIRITFSNAIVDTNEAGTAIPGLTVYNLSATEASDGAYGRPATGLPYTLSMYTISDNSYVILGLDLSTGSYSALFELHIDAAVFTANGGRKLLDLDSNDIPGQVSDDYINYINVTGGAVITSGYQRSPRAALSTFNGGVGPWTAGTTTLVDTYVVDTNSENNLTAETIAASFTLEQWSPAGWTAVSLGTPVYNNSATPNEFSVTVAQLEVGDIYRTTYDPYAFTESESVRGYVHRGSYDPFATVSRGIQVVDGTAEVRRWTSASMTNYTNGPTILTLNTNATNVNRSTVDLTSIMVKDGDITVFGTAMVDDGVAGTIRIIMPANYEWNSSGTDYVYIAPGTIDDNDTEVLTDDRYFFDVNNPEDGSFTLTF